MLRQVLGRTNREFPMEWLRPVGTDRALIEACIASGLPIDITGQTALWGNALRGKKATTVYCLSDEYLRVTGGMSGSVVEAELVQLMSCLGNPFVDVLLLPLRRRPEDEQILNALAAIEDARVDGLIGTLGFKVLGGSFAVMSTWSMYDAFDLAVIPERTDLGPILPLAQDRRVGLVFEGSVPPGCTGPVLRRVESAADVGVSVAS